MDSTIEELEREIERLKKIIEELKQRDEEEYPYPSEYPYPNETNQKCYSNISREKQILNNIKETNGFRQLVSALPSDYNQENLRVSFSYDAPKTETWIEDPKDYHIKDGRTIYNKTREFESGFSDSTIRKKVDKRMDKHVIVTKKDKQGDVVTYVE